MTTELKKLTEDLQEKPNPDGKIPERLIINNKLLVQGRDEPETMQVEDLAALDVLTEDSVLAELKNKLSKGFFSSFVGDILLILNPNINEDIYNESVSINKPLYE